MVSLSVCMFRVLLLASDDGFLKKSKSGEICRPKNQKSEVFCHMCMEIRSVNTENLNCLIEAELFTQPRNTHFRLRFYFRSSAAAIFCTETTRTIPSTPTHTVGYNLTARIGKKLLNEQAQEMNEDHSTHRIPGIAYNCGGFFFSILSVFKLTLVQIAVLKLFYALATL